MPKERVDRKRLLKEPDEFITTSARALNYMRRNSKWVTAFVIVIFVVGVAFWGWRVHLSRQEKQAQELQAEAYRIYANATGQTDDVASRELLGKAVDRFQTVIQQFRGTQAAWMARVYRGHACYGLGRYDEALHDYEAARNEVPSANAQEMKALALQGLGYVWLAKGDPSRALSYFQQLKEQGGAAFERATQWNIGRCYERLGKTKEALEVYQGLQTASPDAMQRELAKAKVTELSAKAQP